MKVLKMTLENFKGVRSGAYEFGDRTIVKGKNGSGKTTISDGWFWLMTDKNTARTSNPDIRPNDAIDEVVSSVTAEMDFDGKPVEVRKSQKLKRSKTGTVALTNSYLVNSVPKSEKAFKEYMADVGVDFDKFLQCSHPGELFAGINNKKERTALRNLLFEMASNVSDLQVAKQGGDDLAEIAALLVNYKADEIEAIQNGTLRKIRENYGKEGEILRAKIEGLESAKVEVDVKAIRQAIADTEKKIDKLNRSEKEKSDSLSELREKSDKAVELKFRLNKIETEADADIRERINRAENEILQAEIQLQKTDDDLRWKEKYLRERKNTRKLDRANKKKCEEALAKIKATTLTEDRTICPTCQRPYTPKQVAQITENFANAQREKIKKAEDYLADITEKIRVVGKDVAKVDAEKLVLLEKRSGIETKIAELKEMRVSLSEKPKADMSQNEEYQKVLADIKEAESFAEQAEKIEAEIASLRVRKDELKREVAGYERQLSLEEQNNRIDSQIAKLREDQSNYEQQKADAEKILYQLKMLNMRKNEMLEESVNSNFELIRWKLFTELKNGEIKDACIPMIDGKEFGKSMNTALEIAARIDAVNGIQKYFGLDYPIFLDDAEHLDSESMKKLKTDHQLIVLTVTDDERLVIDNA